tara:strand:- start:561 stop:716 length:156 start_codon:yes stop_codon:yes gene_type:complete
MQISNTPVSVAAFIRRYANMIRHTQRTKRRGGEPATIPIAESNVDEAEEAA